MELSEYLESRRALINEALESYLSKDDSPQIIDAQKYIVLGGGKRVRSCLCLLICESLGGAAEDALDAALAVELAHCSSLADDDLIDNDTVRRGKPAAWVSLGTKRAIMVSHVLLPFAVSLVAKHGLRAVKVFLDSWASVARGQVYDSFLEGGWAGKGYIAIIGMKTAALFSNSATLGAMFANAGRKYERIATDYGRKLGLSFQIADDISDSIMGKAGPSEVAFLTWLGLEGIKDRAGNIHKRALSLLEDYIAKAQEEAMKFPQSQFKNLLIEFPEWANRAMLKEAGVTLIRTLKEAAYEGTA